MTALTRWEQETVVNYNNEERTCSVYTADPVVMRKLDALCEKYPEQYKCIKVTDISKTYEFDKKLISFRAPKILTEEQKAECRARLERIRKN